jgi:hypothetical protein
MRCKCGQVANEVISELNDPLCTECAIDFFENVLESELYKKDVLGDDTDE